MGTTPPSKARQELRAFAPELIALTDEVVFGRVWARDELSPRDRSLITVAALVTLGREEQLKSHVRRALDNGVTQEELVEIATHLAFYAGWPAAMSAAMVMKSIIEDAGGDGVASDAAKRA
jgi:4-carboxymuconolactone decarboxylase